MGRGRLAYIDGLRGIAVSAVLLSHIAEEIERAGVPSMAVSRGLTALCVDGFNGGRFGVALFFLVSGFVIPFSLKGTRALRDFVVSRAFRLLPALWVSIAIALPVLWLTQHRFPDVATIVTNAAMLQLFVGAQNLQNAYWTLPVELAFYTLAAAMFAAGLLGFRAVVGWSMRLLVLSVLASAVLGLLHLTVDLMLPRYLSLMLLGTAWRSALSGGDAAERRTCHSLTAAHLLALPLLYGAVWTVDADHARYSSALSWVSSQTLAILLFVTVVIRARPPARIVAWFGRISYSVYLVHGLWLATAFALLPPDGGWTSAAGYVALVTIGTVVSALALFHGVELPALALHRALKRDVVRPNPLQPANA